LLGWPVVVGLAVLTLLITGLGLFLRARGALLRFAGLALLVMLLAGPEWVRQTVRPLPDVVVVAVDQSQSMRIAGRDAMAAAALKNLAAQAAKLPGLVVRQVVVPAADDGGTALFSKLAPSLAEVPSGQLAGVIAITDGQVAGVPAHRPFAAPMTALLTAKFEETDRELRLVSAPQYGLVGKNVSLRLEVFDHGVADAGLAVAVTVTEDGQSVWQGDAMVGQVLAVDVPVRHAGRAVVTASAAPLAGEVSRINDQTAFTLNGITKKLEVLLISGNPNQGERSWRLLLKSDPAVELVHFTILRNPEEVLDAPPEDVALVPFPVEQLFNTDIDKFDLIILDEFNSAGLLPPQYLQNMADYVTGGGALLVQTGPEFEGPNSLANTALGAVLPALPVSPGTVTENFVPAVTDLGARHPVTAPFAGQALAPWQRLEAAAPATGDVLMTGGGAENWPLLLLAGEGRGRVAMLLSDQFWLWTRGGAHDGPALPLLRRVVHWLLREPALEAEFLSAQVDHGDLQISRQSLQDQDGVQASVTGPDGGKMMVTLHRGAAGVYAGDIHIARPGVWRIGQGGLQAYAINPLDNAEEYQNLAASGVPLGQVARTVWLGNADVPNIAAMITRRHAQQVTGTRDEPLAPPVLAMILALLLLAAAWWRERG
jgi:uncharacterized membrane protein